MMNNENAKIRMIGNGNRNTVMAIENPNLKEIHAEIKDKLERVLSLCNKNL